MSKEKENTKKSKGLKSSSKSVKNTVPNNEEDFVIPFEAACSPEFAEGCILREDEED